MDTSSAIHIVLGLLLLSGLLLGLVAARFGLPRVAAYVLAGVLFSPSLLGGLLGVHVGTWAEPLTTSRPRPLPPQPSPSSINITHAAP